MIVSFLIIIHLTKQNAMCEEANQRYIKQYLLKQFGLPADQIDTLLPSFFEAVAEHQFALERAVESGDIETIGRAAHKFKGALLNLGMKKSAALALTIEHAAKQKEKSFAFQPTTIKLGEMIAPLFD